MFRWWAFKLTVLLFYLATSEERNGLDVSHLMFSFDMQCFKEKGYEFIVVQAYRSFNCFPNLNTSDTIQQARVAGFEYIDIYMSPCPRDVSANDSVGEMSKYQRIIVRR